MVVIVLVLPRQVASVIHSETPRLGGLLLIAIIADEDAGMRILARSAHDDLAVFAGRNGIAVLVHEINAVVRNRLAHRAGLEGVPEKIAERTGGLGLSEALEDLEARGLLELDEHLGIQCLARGSRVLNRREVVLRDVLLDEHAVHRRRRTKRGDTVFREHRQHLFGMEPVEIVDENRTFAEPLSVKLTPHRLRPSGFGYREVESVTADLMPVLGGDIVSERILVGMKRHLRIAGRSRGEEHEHRIGTAGTLPVCRAPCPLAADSFDLLVEIAPAVLLAVDRDLDDLPFFDFGLQLLKRLIGVLRHVAIGGDEERLHVRRLDAIGKIVGHELAGGGNDDRADLVDAEDDRPELPVTLQNEHHLIAAADAEGRKIVRNPVGLPGDISKRKPPFALVIGDVHHRQFVRILSGNLINDIVGEIESRKITEFDVLELTLGRVFLRDKARGDKRGGEVRS